MSTVCYKTAAFKSGNAAGDFEVKALFTPGGSVSLGRPFTRKRRFQPLKRSFFENMHFQNVQIVLWKQE